MADFSSEIVDGYRMLFIGVSSIIDNRDAESPAQFSSGAAATPVFYKMVGKDSACPTLTYHAWVVQDTPDFTGAQAGALPCGGPLIDIYIADTWT